MSEVEQEQRVAMWSQSGDVHAEAVHLGRSCVLAQQGTSRIPGGCAPLVLMVGH
jgi:hypothetical protein